MPDLFQHPGGPVKTGTRSLRWFPILDSGFRRNDMRNNLGTLHKSETIRGFLARFRGVTVQSRVAGHYEFMLEEMAKGCPGLEVRSRQRRDWNHEALISSW